jgi:adenylosuccinate lyase
MSTTSINPLFAISAVDGRYRTKVESLAPYVSEFGLIRYRVQVECRWFDYLARCPDVPELATLSKADSEFVLAIGDQFDAAHAEQVKAFEAVTNHDVKAVEYFVKDKIRQNAVLAGSVEWVHFACTSEDINNTAYGLMLSEAREQVILPTMDSVISTIDDVAQATAELAMLSRTHGQTASPTTLGKELKNVCARLSRQRDQFAGNTILAKFNGAVGNFNAHASAYPDADWPTISARFIAELGLTNNAWTTQIEPHDYMAELFHALCRFNQVLLDFDRDIWSYIAIDYFKQRKVDGETGSSTMPHKINPIDFENSEGNLGVANALLEHMASKLVVSRWQRDLSDSTVLRNIGAALGYCLIAYQATLRGLSRLEVNQETITTDVSTSWEVLAEPVQTVMRKYGMEEPYEQLKSATRGQQLDEALFQEILAKLSLPADAIKELAQLRPESYTGYAASLARKKLD